jgi:hypothetical protein
VKEPDESDVSTAEAAASKTTEAPAATATAPRLVRAVRREEEKDGGR